MLASALKRTARPADLDASPEMGLGSKDSRSDGQIIEACLCGDAAAWETLLERYGRLIYSIPLRYGLSSEEAADIFQTVCLILLEKLEGLRDRAKLSSWLITVTTRECWAMARRRNLVARGPTDSEDEVCEEVDDSPLPEEIALMWESQHAVRMAVLQLPERCQRLLWYLFYDSSCPPYTEISRRLGIPAPSIGPTRARCLEKLRGILELEDG